MERGSFEMMKKINQQIILRVIYENKAISRARIAENTNLSPATVSNNVKELLEMNLIKETTQGESRGGRKPVLLELNPEGGYFVGLEWGIGKVKGVLLNLNQEIVNFLEEPVESYRVESYIDITVKMVHRFQKKMIGNRNLYGIGIGVHGLVDPEQGVSLFAPHFKWRNVKLRERINEKLKIPVFIDNDVRMMALAEKWNGEDDFIFINTGPGLGAAMVFNGCLFTGSKFSAGELGHMTVVEDGPLCSCGNKGCLEALISLEYLVTEYIGKEEAVGYMKLKKHWYKMIKGAEKNDKGAVKILKNAGHFLGIGIANIVNLLNPESIFIGGDFLEGQSIIFPLVREEVKKRALEVSRKDLRILPTSFGHDVGAVGAATRVFQELLKLERGVGE